jgi:hypothetical protein
LEPAKGRLERTLMRVVVLSVYAYRLERVCGIAREAAQSACMGRVL